VRRGRRPCERRGDGAEERRGRARAWQRDPDATRRHAHRTLHQVVICLSGGLEVHLDDGVARQMVHLNRPWLGLYVPPMVWASEGNFDPGTVYLVLTSDYYNEADYVRDYDEFLAASREAGRAP
jgi:hypothetical protein